jgi:DNA polymerase-3 subunit delta
LFLASELLPATHWLVKAVPAVAVVPVRPLPARELPGWLQQRAAAHACSLSEEAAQLLVQSVGEDLTTLVAELEKASLWAVSAGGRVGVEEVEAVVGQHRLRSVFELTTAVARRTLGQALGILEALLEAGEEPLGLLGMLTREVRLTWSAKAWLKNGKSPEEIARLVRLPLSAVETVLARAESCSWASLTRQLSRCWEVERRLKAGGFARSELTLLLADLCRAG